MAGHGLGAIERRVQAIAPAAQISAHRDSGLGRCSARCATVQWLSFGLVLLLGAAATAAVVLAARGALDTHRFTIEVMHGVGATDVQVTHLFQRKMAVDALVGSLSGAAVGALVLLLLAGGASFAGDLSGGATLSADRLPDPAPAAVCVDRACDMGCAPAVLAALRETLMIAASRRFACCSMRSASSCSHSRWASPRRRARATDAAIVLTGGSGRIEHGIDDLREGKAKRLLVAGADPSVTKRDLAQRISRKPQLLKCCVDLGSESVDTRSNAEEAARWLAKHNFHSLRLITSDWHMRRARYEFDKVLGPQI